MSTSVWGVEHADVSKAVRDKFKDKNNQSIAGGGVLAGAGGLKIRQAAGRVDNGVRDIAASRRWQKMSDSNDLKSTIYGSRKGGNGTIHAQLSGSQAANADIMRRSGVRQLRLAKRPAVVGAAALAGGTAAVVHGVKNKKKVKKSMTESVWGIDHGESVSKKQPGDRNIAFRSPVYNSRKKNIAASAVAGATGAAVGGGVVNHLFHPGSLRARAISTGAMAGLGAVGGAALGALDDHKGRRGAAVRQRAYNQSHSNAKKLRSDLGGSAKQFGRDAGASVKSYRKDRKALSREVRGSYKKIKKSAWDVDHGEVSKLGMPNIGSLAAKVKPATAKIKPVAAGIKTKAADFGSGVKAGFKGNLKASPNKAVPASVRPMNAGVRTGQIGANRNVQIGAGAGVAGIGAGGIMSNRKQR